MVHVAVSPASQPTEQEKLGGGKEMRLISLGNWISAVASVRADEPVLVTIRVYVVRSPGPTTSLEPDM
jgi:hypothetical protein